MKVVCGRRAVGNRPGIRGSEVPDSVVRKGRAVGRFVPPERRRIQVRTKIGLFPDLCGEVCTVVRTVVCTVVRTVERSRAQIRPIQRLGGRGRTRRPLPEDGI